MRSGAGILTPATSARGLTLQLVGKYKVRKRLKSLEVTERRQVGDAQDLLNRSADAGDAGYFRPDSSKL